MAHVLKKPQTKKRPTRWEVRYRVNGKWHGKTFTREADARRFKSTIEADLARGDWLDPRMAQTLFSKVAADWWERKPGNKERTRTGYGQLLNKHVLPFFGRMPVGSITPDTVDKWKKAMEANGSGPGVIRNACRNVLKPVLDLALRQNLIRANPAAGLKLARSPKSEMLFLTPAQVELLANELPAPYGTLVLFAAYTGLRAGEICALRMRHLDLMRRRVDVKESVTLNPPYIYGPTKTYTRRQISLPPFLLPMLTAQVAPYASDPEAFVFRSPRRPRLVYGSFYGGHFRPAAVRSLPPHLHSLRFHDLRHTFASILIALGKHPKVIQERMGHSSIQVTFDRYGHLLPNLEDGDDEALALMRRKATEVARQPEATITSLA